MLTNDFLFPETENQENTNTGVENPAPLPNCYPPPKNGFFTPPPHLTIQEEFLHTTRRVNETLERVLRLEKHIVSRVDATLKAIAGDNETFKDLVISTYNQFASGVTTEVNSFEDDFTNSYNLFKNELSVELETLRDDYLKKLTEHKEEITTGFNTYKDELTTAFNTHRDAVEDRLVKWNESYTKSFNDYINSVNTTVTNMGEAFNTKYESFTASITERVDTFIAQVETRLDGQDSMINDAVLYMKSNLKSSLSELLTGMKNDGEFDALVNDVIVPDLNIVKARATHIVTPEEFLVGYDEFDINESTIGYACYQALNKGGVVVLKPNTTYSMGDYELNIPENTVIIGNGATLTGWSIYSINKDNITIENITFNCGMDITGNNITLKNCKFTGYFYDSPSIQVRYNGENLLLDKCEFTHFETEQTNRNVWCENTKNVVIRDCIFNGVSGGEEDDALHFQYSSEEYKNANALVENCIFRNSGKRYIKIQADGVTVRNCTFDDTENLTAVAVISAYGNNCNIESNYIKAKSPVAVQVGHGVRQDNINIHNNFMQLTNGMYQGIISTSYPIPNGEFWGSIVGLSIKGNTLVGYNESNDYSPFYGIMIRDYNISKMVVTDNIINDVSYGVYFIDDNDLLTVNMLASNIIINNNNIDYNYSIIGAKEVSGLSYFINGLNVNNNTSGASINENKPCVDLSNFIITNKNVRVSGNTNNLSSKVEFIRTKGWLNAIPTDTQLLTNGTTYFAFDDKLTYTYYDGKWYKPDGTEKV